MAYTHRSFIGKQYTSQSVERGAVKYASSNT